MLRDQPRIVVVGTSGSGKTTLARRLAGVLERPHIELDALFWGPNWTPRPEFRERVTAAIEGERWVLDGNFSRVRDIVWPRATAIIWLNYALPLVLYRALRRTIQRVGDQQDLYGNNRESSRGAFIERDGIPWVVLRTFQRRRREYRQLLAGQLYPRLSVFELTRTAQAEALLAESAQPLV